MTMGMPYIDMAFLIKSDIGDGRIKFQRKKTSKMYDIKVTEQMRGIFKFYILKGTVKTLYSLSLKEIHWNGIIKMQGTALLPMPFLKTLLYLQIPQC